MNASPTELPIPGLIWGQYPERRSAGAGSLARWAAHLPNRARRHAAFLDEIEALQPAMLQWSVQQCAAEAQRLRQQLGRRGMADELVAAVFALFFRGLAPPNRTAPIPDAVARRACHAR